MYTRRAARIRARTGARSCTPPVVSPNGSQNSLCEGSSNDAGMRSRQDSVSKA
jgi:hypothetical protein